MKIKRFKDIPQFTKTGNYQVDLSPAFLVKWIDDEIEEMSLILDPDFQRGHIWTENQQIQFLEYFFRGGRSGNVLYFNYPSWHSNSQGREYNDYVCVDGLQRITSIQKFINNEIRIFGSFYKEFEDNIRMSDSVFKVNVNDLKTKKEVLQWYIDINAGGTPHSTEEINRVAKMLIEME